VSGGYNGGPGNYI